MRSRIGLQNVNIPVFNGSKDVILYLQRYVQTIFHNAETHVIQLGCTHRRS